VGTDRYVGTRIELNGPRTTIDFFFGLLTDAREALFSGDLQEIAKTTHQRTPSTELAEVLERTATRGEGTILSMELIRRP
jgi:hypothetical protein